MTEHLTPHEGRKAPAARPTAPADPRGALLRSPETSEGGGSTAVPSSDEHTQSPAAEPDPHRPRPVPESGVPS
ncbi:hypothetical protein, partial [Streptomyces sp. SID10115]